ncbi:hypothetical protein MXB02_04225 [Pseudomonas mosselii]|uniref:hypothetical protein n=1 Tax=Pseudomonas mosselii TaxID=78327 RepID=UPI001983B818|nr:hypothetical protein [Pseudomonas mosselii]MBC7209496.1 hypothetical protein [Pseudomonas sp.]UPF04853.1 hypothetical protein MXB02_04225 [Pseudomonas mosselii]
MSQTVEEAQAAFEAAKAAYLDELRRDCERGEGSYNQELRREQHQQELRDEKLRCEQALQAAKRRQAESDGQA